MKATPSEWRYSIQTRVRSTEDRVGRHSWAYRNRRGIEVYTSDGMVAFISASMLRRYVATLDEGEQKKK